MVYTPLYRPYLKSHSGGNLDASWQRRCSGLRSDMATRKSAWTLIDQLPFTGSCHAHPDGGGLLALSFGELSNSGKFATKLRGEINLGEDSN